MWPTIKHSGDHLLILRISSPILRRFVRPIQRGDLIVAASPVDPGASIGKRVIGLPGDSIWLDPSGTATDDDEDGDGDGDGAQGTMRPEQAAQWIRVPKGKIWVEGDNPANSRDSRTYGPIPQALVYGRVIARFRFSVRGRGPPRETDRPQTFEYERLSSNVERLAAPVRLHDEPALQQ